MNRPRNVRVIDPPLLNFDRDEEASQLARYVSLHGYDRVLELMNDPHVLQLIAFSQCSGKNSRVGVCLIVFRYFDGGEMVSNCDRSSTKGV